MIKNGGMYMFSEITIKEIDEIFDTLDILLLIRKIILEKYNISLNASKESFKNDFEVRVEPNYNPNDFPNIQIHFNHRDVTKNSK